jgi:hypothetical protein
MTTATSELPVDIKAQLDSLSTQQGPVSIVEVLEPLSIQEAFSYVEEQIHKIDDTVDQAINYVTKALRGIAAVRKGQLLYELNHRYFVESPKEYEQLYGEFLKRNNIKKAEAQRWLDAAQYVRENGQFVDPGVIGSISASALTIMQSLPSQEKDKLIDKMAETGKPVTAAEVKEVANAPETKLHKAEEVLKKYQAQKEQAIEQVRKAESQELSPDDPKLLKIQDKLTTAERNEQRLLLQIEELKHTVEETKAKRIQEQNQREQLEAELEQLRTDDDATRMRRVNALSQSLTATIPDVTSDLQKFFAELEFYTPTYQEAILDSCKNLCAYLTEQLKKLDD